MFNLLKTNEKKESSSKKNTEIALCALLLEVANCDDKFSEDEKKLITDIVKDKFNLEQEEADELIKTAEQERNRSIDLWHFTKLINDNYSNEEKFELMEMLWGVVFADSVLDQHEDHILHTLNKLLKMDHRDMIAAKINARNKLKSG